MKHRRVLSLVLALCIALSLLPVASAAGTATYKGTSYSTNYATWRQADPAWGPTALGDVHTMAASSPPSPSSCATRGPMTPPP